MISPSEIRTKVFEKGIKGYRTESVEVFLNSVASDVEALIEENKELESKLNILAEKLEEYKSDEDSLRDALLGAQKLGSNVIKEAKNKAEGIIKEANLKSEKVIIENDRKIERQKQSIVKLQKEVADFKKKLMISYKQLLEIINDIPMYEETEPKEETLQDIKEYMESGQAARDEHMLERMENHRKESKKKENSSDKENSTKKSTDNGTKDGDTIRFSLNPQEKQAETKKDEKTNLNDKVHPSSESRFGPLLFGEDYKIERNSK